MKINNNNRMDIAKIYSDNKPKAVPNRIKEGQKYDRVEISKEGMEIAKYASAGKGTSDVRVQKLNEIKNKIQNGTYKVSSEELASKILEAIKEGK